MSRGRPITVNVKENPNYFNEYYHMKNKECTCECGNSYLYYSKHRHMKSKKHITLMKFKILQDEIDSLKKEKAKDLGEIVLDDN